LAPSPISLVDVARSYSPRVEVLSEQIVLLDLEGLTRLFGDASAIGERLRQSAVEQGHAPVRVALAATRTAAILLAAARAGVTVVPEGDEAAALAPLPLRMLQAVEMSLSLPASSLAPSRPAKAGRHEGGRGSRSPNPESRILGRRSLVRLRAERYGETSTKLGERSRGEGGPNPDALAVLSRWGLRTLGDLAALPAADLSARLGQAGVWWQRLARGEAPGPLVPTAVEELFEASLELEWPIDGLEPLSFILTRLLDPLCQRLERRDRGAAVLHVRLRLVTRALHLRSLQLPAPMRDPKVLRTLLLLDLESHPAPAGIDVVTIAIDPTPGRIVQESLLTRARPAPEQISTLLARLQALMGEGRCGSPALVDSHRPGAFAMTPFRVVDEPRASERDACPAATLRRFRLPIPARVLIEHGRPISVRTDRQSLQGGRVQTSAGPWRTSGEWWKTAAAPAATELDALRGRVGWNRDEWDVALSDGAIYRVFEDRDSGRWFVEAVVD
jgi:protein ImuB